MFGTVTSGSSLAMFPIDYRALNSEPSEMETFRQQMLTSIFSCHNTRAVVRGFQCFVDVDFFPTSCEQLDDKA